MSIVNIPTLIKLRFLIHNLNLIKLQPFNQHALLEERDDEDDHDGDYVCRDASSDDGDDYEDDNYDDDDYDDDDEENEEEADDAYEDIVSNLPAESSLARKRKLKTTKGVYDRKKHRDSRNIRKKTAVDRKKDYPDGSLKVVDKLLFCVACDTEIKGKDSTIKPHFKSKAHLDKVATKSKNSKALVDYSGVIQRREQEHNTAGSTIPLNTLSYRMKVTHALLKHGVCFSILDHGSEVRELFEDGHCTMNKDSCSSFIPVLND